MAQYQAKLRSLASDVALPPSLAQRPFPGPEAQADPEWDNETEDEDAAIIAARLGGVDRFD
jgi:hypothetical protein